MKAKKQSSSSTVALMHLVVGGFVIPLIGYGLLYFALSALFPDIFETDRYELLLEVASWAVALALLIAGVIYSSDYIADTYVIKELRVIVIKSTYYFALLTSAGIILGFILDDQATFAIQMINAAASILNVVVFYYVSQRFLPKAVLKHSQKELDK